MLKILIHTALSLLLTILTQVGGIIYLANLVVVKRYSLSALKGFVTFLVGYLLCTFIVLPITTPWFGRTALPIAGTLQPLNFMTCLLNRHYVKPDLKNQLVKISHQMAEKFDGTKTNYLDANFPLWDGFPLMPHLSHNDGKKIDLAFYYKDANSKERTNNSPSFIGYGIYDRPTIAEHNMAGSCEKKGYWQYSFLGYMVPSWYEKDYVVDQERTAAIIKLLSDDSQTLKIFIEPHLKERWNLSNFDKIRFHGCQAVRHDDHIHTQIR